MRGSGVLSDATVTNLSSTIIGQEWGFTGIVCRIHLHYDQPEPGAPQTIVAKFPNAAGETLSTYREAQQRDPIATRRYYERCAREIWFYQEVAPASDLPAPRMYYGAADFDTGRFVLLLEDLGALRVGDVLAGCSVSDAGSVLQAIGPFHAQWWKSSALDEFDWIPDWTGDPDARHEWFSRGVESFLERYRDRIPEEIRELIIRLHPVYRDVIKRLASAPATLIHADLHLDNIVFGPPGGARIIDWQSIARGPAAYDVALFLCGSLDPAPRRESIDALVDGYYQMLTQSGVEEYSRDGLWHDLRLALLCILAGNVNWLGSADLTTLAGRELALVNAVIDDNRLFTALIDLEVSDLLSP